MGGDSYLTNIGQQVPGVLSMISMGIDVIGLIMVAMGLYNLATAGSNRGQSTHGYGGGIALTVFGALMLNLSGTAQVFLNSVYGGGVNALGTENTPLSVFTGATQTQQWIIVLFEIMVVLGWIACARGLMHLGFFRTGARERGMKSGLIWLSTGSLLTNPYGIAYLIGASFGVSNVVNMIIPQSPY